ncbi:MAG: carboxypeptidase-like regulatory domain-containing protein [Tannerella sp.]|jgi:hypothetical protein|nr:carboxypeptidase-like regulatory domain-containing protein [Tannerella sp.]
MKAKRLLSVFLMLAIALLSNGMSMNAQENEITDFYTISGVVKDKNTKKTIDYVNISAVGTNVGTVTNEEGEFSLKISNALNVKEIQLSGIGYYNALITISGNNKEGQTFFLTPESFLLSEVQVFSWRNPRDLVKAAIDKVGDNYAMNPNMLTGFYRETIQKRRKYINISEAVIEIYKGGYDLPADRDQVRVLKGRKLISPKMSDTLSVKFLGGPNMPVFLDMVKNPDILLDKEILPFYSFKMGEATSIDDRLQYTVHFKPQMITEYPLYIGTLYIDREILSFTRAEFSMEMQDKQKVINAILKEKPKGLRFTPEEVLFVVTYKQQGSKTYLNYIRNEIKFKCDWKRKLFATNYTVTGETVITDRNEQHVFRIPNKETFTIRQSLSQEVSLYQDENFWSNYNIIEPTESLESAVNRLKKQHLKSQ